MTQRGPVHTLPSAVRDQLEAALDDRGAAPITEATPVSGGCINNGARVGTEDGRTFFVKWNVAAPERMFEAEADGLDALASTDTLRVPEPLASGGGGHTPVWLLLEYIAPGSPAGDYPERLGSALARLHLSRREGPFGWPRDNWIGALDQSNEESGSWSVFWRERRISPQLELARESGFLKGAVLDRLLDVIPAALEDVDSGGLLHGDLWGGNAYAGEDGGPVVIDPAVYRGHGEVDLAMTELFGGFGRRFYTAYDTVLPITSEYAAYRRDLYQLYYLLVHVNLFGGSYEPGSLAAAQRVVDALS